MKTRIADYKTFKQDIVDVDRLDFLKNHGDIRRAFHCAISLFHLSDWVYDAHKAAIDAAFSYKSGAKIIPVSDSAGFANALSDLNGDFALIRGVANSAKHLKLTHKSARATPPHTPTHAANTVARSYGGFNDAPIGAGPLGGWTEVELEGANRSMTDIANSVHAMWEQLFQQHSW